MPNESSGKDLEIFAGHVYVMSLHHGVIHVTKCQGLFPEKLLIGSQ